MVLMARGLGYMVDPTQALSREWGSITNAATCDSFSWHKTRRNTQALNPLWHNYDPPQS